MKFTSASQSYESVDSALLNAWQRLVNTSAYRALLEVLNAARIDRKLRLRISAELVAWGKNLDKQSLTIYQSANEQLPNHEGDAEVVMLLNMTRSFMRGLLTQEQYGVSPEETLTYVAKWVELIAPMLKLRGIVRPTSPLAVRWSYSRRSLSSSQLIKAKEKKHRTAPTCCKFKTLKTRLLI